MVSGHYLSPEHLRFNRDFLVTQRSDSISTEFRHRFESWLFQVIQTYYFSKILSLGTWYSTRDTKKCVVNVVCLSYANHIDIFHAHALW